MKKFIRQEAKRHSKLGKNRKKLQKWRKPKGRDSKMREKRKGYSKSPTVGNKTPRKNLKKTILIHNQKEINSVDKNASIILARVGAKKKLELIKHAREKNLKILNVKENKK